MVDSQDPNWCPTTTDQVLPGIIGLLPQGPTFSAANREGSVQNQFWSSIANLTGWVNQRICDFVNELFCSTAVESIDQWLAEYGLPDACDPYGTNVCAKETAYGGQTCDYFVQIAAGLGWVIDCDFVDAPLPVVGCFQVGCTPLGPPAVPRMPGSNIGFGELTLCMYGPAIDHPEPEYWAVNQGAATCTVPGSTLGVSQVGPGCCFTVGYFDAPVEQAFTVLPGACDNYPSTIYFDIPAPDNVALIRVPTDTTGNFDEYTGYDFVWNVTVHLSESTNLRKSDPNFQDPDWSLSGTFQVGCQQLNGIALDPILCFLERIKPAHTTINYIIVD